MPIGIVSDSEFDSELNSITRVPQNKTQTNDSETRAPETIVGEIVDSPSPGRKEGDVNVPDSLRKVLADTHLIEGRSVAAELAKNLDISSSSVSAYANGTTSTASQKKDPSLNSFLTNRKSRIAKRAAKILHSSLDEITPERVSTLKITDIANVAKVMSSIIKDMEPEREKENNGPTIQAAQIIMYAPPIQPESKFDVITLNE